MTQPVAPEGRWRLSQKHFGIEKDGKDASVAEACNRLNALEAEVAREKEANRLVQSYIADLQAEVAALRVKAELADRVAETLKSYEFYASLELWEKKWLADYEAAQKLAEPPSGQLSK